MGFGERYTAKDIANFFEAVPIEDNKFPAKYCSDMITGKLKDDQWLHILTTYFDLIIYTRYL